MAKVRLDSRLAIEVIRRLQSVSSRKKISVSDVVADALDAWEREQNVAEKVGERLEYLEKNLLALVELNGKFEEKLERHFSQAEADLKLKLRSLYILLEGKIEEFSQGGKP